MKKVFTVSKTRLGAASSASHEMLIAKLRFKWKKAGKNTRPFRYDINPIPYDYTVEVRNRFKGLHLTDRVPHKLRTFVGKVMSLLFIMLSRLVIAFLPRNKRLLIS